jgi:hypothetical protein
MRIPTENVTCDFSPHFIVGNVSELSVVGLARVARVASPFQGRGGRVRVARCGWCVCENSNLSPQSSPLAKGRGGTTAVELTANGHYLHSTAALGVNAMVQQNNVSDTLMQQHCEDQLRQLRIAR